MLHGMCEICERCGYTGGSVLYDDLLGEVDFDCPRCGHTFKTRLIPDREHLYMRRKDGSRVYRSYEPVAKGAYRIGDKASRRLRRVPSARKIRDFKAKLLEPGMKGYMTLWDPKSKTVKVIAGEFYD